MKRLAAAILCICVLLLASGCATTRSSSRAEEGNGAAKEIAHWSRSRCQKARKTIVRKARSRIGCRYRSAGRGPRVFDCSGLAYYAYSAAGINIPTNSTQQFISGRRLDSEQALKQGDLVFFSRSKGSLTPGHVGIVVSYDRISHNFTFVHAANSGVELQHSTARYYSERYIGAVRIIPK